MEPTDKHDDKELDKRLAVPQLRVPIDFAAQVMRRVDDLPSPFLATTSVSVSGFAPTPVRGALWRRRLRALSKRRIGILSLPQILAFVFGIMLATAAG